MSIFIDELFKSELRENFNEDNVIRSFSYTTLINIKITKYKYKYIFSDFWQKFPSIVYWSLQL